MGSLQGHGLNHPGDRETAASHIPLASQKQSTHTGRDLETASLLSLGAQAIRNLRVTTWGTHHKKTMSSPPNMRSVALSELGTAASQGQLRKSTLPVHLSLHGICVPSLKRV